MIRDATDSDAAAIAGIYNYYIRNTVVTFETDAVDGANILSRIHRVNESSFPWLVAVENESVIGYAYAAKWNQRAAYRNTAEVSVYISHDHMGKGWGSKLYDALFTMLRQKGIHVAIGGVTLPNPASVSLHEKFGMTQVAHFREVGNKFGRWLDVGYWQATLSQ
jgi:L-amino acid N-acyltransferase YncA